MKHAPIAQLDRASGYGPEGYGFESCLARHYRDLAQLGRALGLGPRCRRFESYNPDHFVFIGRYSLMVEHQPSKLIMRVRFSLSAPDFSFRDLAQLGRALGLGPRCRRFESYNPDHFVFIGRYSLMVEHQPSKLIMRVRFSLSAPDRLLTFCIKI